jgi:hypothetical protein
VAEITGLLDLSLWPQGSRVLVRREEPHPGASYNLFDPRGLRHQALITNSNDTDLAYLEARHRLHARVEDRIKEAKECGLANFPCASFQANRVWLLLVQMAQDLLAWAGSCASPLSSWRRHPSDCATSCSTWPDGWCAAAGRAPCGSTPAVRGRLSWRQPSRACGLYR